MKYSACILGVCALQVSAFPLVLEQVAAEAASKRQNAPAPGSAAARAVSAARKNCGVVPCTTFNATEQYVSISGAHVYKAPTASQIRGPCPGLNAAANHAYLPRSGVPTIAQTINGLADAFGMSVDLSGFLAAFAVAVDGDPITRTWSIGGPPPRGALSLLGAPQGISYSHNNYENDASIARYDAYLNNGDAHSLSTHRFAQAYAYTDPRQGRDRYTLDKFAQNYLLKTKESIATNPYAFWAPFSGLVAPAAYNFVINFMSNHTAANPNGYFNGAQFKTFFAVSGTPGNFVWNRGQERIPENWYRRPTDNAYSIAGVFEDLGAQFLAYPESLLFGGNTGKVNTFTGVDLGNLTGGAFNAQTILEGNNLQCFFAQFAQAAIPDAASTALQTAVGLLKKLYLAPVLNGLDCPAVADFDQTLLNQYPGYKYNPTGGATNW